MADSDTTRGASETGDPLLFTPGPLTTSRTVKAAMLHDWGSRDPAFLTVNAELLEELAGIVNARGSHVTVPLAGSGTAAVEAMLTTFVPRDGAALLLCNGVYGERAQRICAIAARRCMLHRTCEDTPPDVAAIDHLLAREASITHVFLVHCETTSGILNPLPAIAELTARHGRRLLIDAMSAFGALPLDAATTPFDALAASSNKCLEGVPGLGFVICRSTALAACRGNATTLTLDLYDQWQAFVASGQYRFTPPTHVIAALWQALAELRAEGGQPGRARRYARNCRVLIDGMRALGFIPFLPAPLQAPIIVTFHMPRGAHFAFQAFYDRLAQRGYVIYPGKLTRADSFRIGCIGRIDADHMRGLVAAVGAVLAELGVDRLD